MAASTTETEAPLDINTMTKVQKLAALLIILGPESSAQILKQFDEHELETVAAEMTKITMLNQELQRAILQEFNEVAVEASTAVLGGLSYTQNTLEKSVGLFRANNIITRVAPSRTPVAAMQQIVEMEARQVFNLIKQEQPQTIALIISYLPSDKSSQLLMLLRPELREQVIERLATLAPTPIEVVEKVVEILNQKAGGKHTRALNQTGGLKSAAQLLNSIDKNVSKSLLVSLEERNPDLCRAIQQKMFTFEDLAALESTSLQKVMREVDMRDLAVALKTSSEKLKSSLLGCISKRAAETVTEEMGFMGPLKLRDIEVAQQRIIDVVRKLESEGEVEIEGSDNRSRETAPR